MSDLNHLRELRLKYLTMRAMRTATTIAPRDELRAFSQRWPGALAEIDRIPMTLIEQRIAELDRAIEGSSREPPPMWARAWILTHRRLRGALAIKLWLKGRRTLDDDETRLLAQAQFPPESELYRARLDEVASPPEGRVMELVLRDVAAELGLESHTMLALLMPRG